MNFNKTQIYLTQNRVRILVIRFISFVYLLQPRYSLSGNPNIHLKCFSITLRIGNCTRFNLICHPYGNTYIYIGTHVCIHCGINQGHLKRLIPKRMQLHIMYLIWWDGCVKRFHNYDKECDHKIQMLFQTVGLYYIYAYAFTPSSRNRKRSLLVGVCVCICR